MNINLLAFFRGLIQQERSVDPPTTIQSDANASPTEATSNQSVAFSSSMTTGAPPSSPAQQQAGSGIPTPVTPDTCAHGRDEPPVDLDAFSVVSDCPDVKTIQKFLRAAMTTIKLGKDNAVDPEVCETLLSTGKHIIKLILKDDDDWEQEWEQEDRESWKEWTNAHNKRQSSGNNASEQKRPKKKQRWGPDRCLEEFGLSWEPWYRFLQRPLTELSGKGESNLLAVLKIIEDAKKKYEEINDFDKQRMHQNRIKQSTDGKQQNGAGDHFPKQPNVSGQSTARMAALENSTGEPMAGAAAAAAAVIEPQPQIRGWSWWGHLNRTQAEREQDENPRVIDKRGNLKDAKNY